MKQWVERLAAGYHWVLQPLIVLAILVAGFLLAQGLTAQREEPPRASSAVYAPLVRVLEVDTTSHVVTVASHGTLRARSRVDLVPQVGGRIVRIHPELRAGGRFRAGEELFAIEPVDYELALMLARADVQAAETALVTLRADAQAAVDEWETLAPEEDAPPLVAREPQIREAEARLEAARSSVESAELALRRTSFSLPFDGRLVRSVADLGQVVGAGQSVGTVYATEVFEVAVALDQDQLRWVELPGDRAGGDGSRARVRATVGEHAIELTGRAVRLEAELDPVSRQARVVVEVRPDELAPAVAARLLPGLFVDVELTGDALEGVSAVPRGAVHEGDIVWVVQDEALRFVPVDVRHASGDELLVSGLEAPARIVTSQLEVVTDGMRVRATAEEDSQP